MTRGFFGWLGGLSAAGLAALLVVTGGTVAAGGVFAYRTYDYVQHDNDFCLSCHLMVEPYELFAESAHRDLGCKACHQPTMMVRSQMALTQIIENPDSLETHAEVGNDKCAHCHIEGDPEKWETIANSAGHRVHLESEDPDLQGLQCVECHSSSLHQFTATDETCAQSGCHTDIRVQLGRMGDFTIHCAACHGFSAPLPDTASVQTALAALAPTNNECLSCHVMRTLVDMPADEPHGQVCSTCHNPHTQTTPAAAVETCATGSCHTDPTELTAFHRGLDHPIVENCTACHSAHDWNVVGSDCLSCHVDIYETDAAPPPASSGIVASAHPPMGSPTADSRVIARLASRDLSAAVPMPPPGSLRHAVRVQEAPGTGPDLVFRHANHRGVECTSCHVSEEEHGRITVTGINDCRSCHHDDPVAQDCRNCHAPSAMAQPTLEVAWPMEFSTGRERATEVDFAHERHADLECSTCHEEGLTRPADVAACNTCHTEHHTTEATCVSCHAAPPATAHRIDAHLTCSGSGCHSDLPFEGVPRQRAACLSCHQDLQDHQPEGECIECHTLPPARSGEHP